MYRSIHGRPCAMTRPLIIDTPAWHRAWLALGIAALVALISEPALAAPKTKNVVLIVLDGVRWQETFSGADPSLINEKHGGIWESEATLRQRFMADDPAKRRELLFPFLWDVVAKQGQIFGNQW